LTSPKLRWAFTANHAHLVPEGVDGFLDGMGVERCDEVRLADCFRNGKELHLKPGQGDFDFSALFRRLDDLGFAGHYMNAFGTLDDMLEGREILSKLDSAGQASPPHPTAAPADRADGRMTARDDHLARRAPGKDRSACRPRRR
jgi:hypothetical protein